MTEKRTKGNLLLESLRADLREGRLGPGDLVGVGEGDAALRGVSAPTLRKAVRILVQEGWLEAQARGARVPRSTQGRMRVVLVRACDDGGAVPFEAERMARFRRHLEIESLRRGWNLEVWGYPGGGVLVAPDGTRGSWQFLSRGAHGVVVSLWGVQDDAWLLGQAARTTLPVAVWDERPAGGERPRSASLKYVDSSYSPGSARALVRHLLASGRRSVAWISPFHGSQWSRARLDGIREAAGPHLLCEAVDSEVRFHEDFSDGDVRLWLDVDGLVDHAGRWVERGVREVVRQTEILLQRRRMVERLEPLFRKALDSGAHAWIGANDDVALLAWDWLAGQGIEVPARVALCGFDDLVFAQERGLTSVYFQEDAVANSCVTHLSRLRAPGEPIPETDVLDGIVVPRLSTNP